MQVQKDSDSLDSVVEVPDDFIFPGCMAFMLWGPFTPPENRLIIFEIKDAPKNAGAIGRATKHKLDLESKEIERVSDANANYGFSTDQMISIEVLFVQKNIQKQQHIKLSMVALIAYERAIASQII